MPILKTVLSRAEALLRAKLVIQPFNLRRKNPASKVYDIPIGNSYIPKIVCIYRVYSRFVWILGNGLFCKEQIRRGQQIVHFIGKVLASREEVLQTE